jgi:hypothetical protein
MLLGPFGSCGLIDHECIRHVTVSTMMASAVRNGSTPDVVLVPGDYPQLPMLPPETTLLEAAVTVVETGWELAVVMDSEPRVIAARSVYGALVSPLKSMNTPTSFIASPLRACSRRDLHKRSTRTSRKASR